MSPTLYDSIAALLEERDQARDEARAIRKDMDELRHAAGYASDALKATLKLGGIRPLDREDIEAAIAGLAPWVTP
jgi:hypothetical protein